MEVIADAIPFYAAERVDATVDVRRSIARVVDRHRYVLGTEVAAFESAFADYCGVAECVGVANGTDALEIALRAVDAGPSDRVVLVANAGFYGTTAIRAIGALPPDVDIDLGPLDPGTLSIARCKRAGKYLVAIAVVFVWVGILGLSQTLAPIAAIVIVIPVMLGLTRTLFLSQHREPSTGRRQ